LTGYVLFRFIVSLVSLLPWRLVSFFSQITFVFLLLFPYRKSVIRTNLSQCFPKKTNSEIDLIQRNYYQFLSRLFWESLKGFSISKEEAQKRFVFKNPEVVSKYLNDGKSVIGLAAHYGNWELGALSSGLFFSKVLGLYKPIKNQRIDRYIREKRGKFGLQLGAIEHTHRIFAKNQASPHFFLLVADQQPSNREKAIWVTFFKRETPCVHGAEMYGKKYHLPVVFIDIIPKGFGEYEAELLTLSENAANETDGVLTQQFMSVVENRIRFQPEFWLWSHKRWKWNQKN
jgi:KDO2-lipid IV(A) lauroyltransferase